MRRHLLAATVLLLGAAELSAADPQLPPIVFQAQSVGRIFDAFRTAANLAGGEKAAKSINKTLQEMFGEKGLEGLDLNRPIVGYVILAPKPEDITAVIALPVVGEKEFLELCDRINRVKMKVDEKDKTLYHLPPLNPRYKAMLRLMDGYAYIAYGFNPAKHIEAKALVPMPKLFDPSETGIFAGRAYFDRIPDEVKKAAPSLFAEVKKTMFGGSWGNVIRVFRFPGEQMAASKLVDEQIDKLLARLAKLSSGADILSVRLNLDPQAGAFVAETAIKPKPGSELARMIAAWKPTTNRFGAIAAHPDTVFGLRTRLPLFLEELQTAANGTVEGLAKAGSLVAPADARPTIDELVKGIVRTVKSGEVDIAVAVRGPDKDGWFTAVGALAFEDPSNLEKELRKYIEKEAPREVQDNLKWNAASVEKVNIHTFKIPAGGGFFFGKQFGDAPVMAFAFAPRGVYFAMSPDPVPVLKDALTQKPVEAPVVDLVANHARVRKLIRKMAPNAAEAARVEEWFGKEDKLASIASLSVAGGTELTIKFTLDMRGIPRIFLHSFGVAESSIETPVPPGKY
ncbi:MAG TPA: hypothetical protein VLM40_11735 [Gemmata sp.]|nr:hypothetical protein [Gemmata sp.]